MLTINDIEKTRFGTSLFGYSRAEVDGFLEEVLATIQAHVEETQDLKKRLAEAEAAIAVHKANEDTLKNSIVLAQKSHDEIVAAAHREAENIIEEARLKSVQMGADFAQLQADRERFEYEFHALLRAFLDRLEARRPELGAGSKPDMGASPASTEGEKSTEREKPQASRDGNDVVFPDEEAR